VANTKFYSAALLFNSAMEKALTLRRIRAF